MKYVLDSSQMKEIDRFSIEEAGIPSIVLMERAALAVCEVLREKADREVSVLCVCGNGNNGADAAACARILNGWGYKTAVCLVGNMDKGTDELKLQLNILEKISVPTVTLDKINDYDVIVDGIFGVGLSRGIEGEIVEIICSINHSNKMVIAVDVPSGINATTGQVMNFAINADYTVTFGYMKTGLILYPGNVCAGEIVVADCGFAPMAIRAIPDKKFIYEQDDVNRLPARRQDSNKGTYGKVLVVAGSDNMSGAAYFAGKAAYRTGAGLVKILTAKSNKDIIAKLLPEAVLGYYDTISDEEIKEYVNWAEQVIIGPGLSTDEQAAKLLYKILGFVRESDAEKKVLLDADALNIISCDGRTDCLAGCVLTPHVGEMARLTGKKIAEIKKDVIGTAVDFAKEHKCICVLKDARSVVTDGDKIYINVSGNSGMSTAGSGDVLTGIIAGMWANGMELFDGAILGTYIHGCAGDVARAELGEYFMKADDIADGIKNVICN